MPLKEETARDRPIHEIAASFIQDNPAVTFFGANDREPDVPTRRHITQ
jgi:hypothetical protein